MQTVSYFTLTNDGCFYHVLKVVRKFWRFLIFFPLAFLHLCGETPLNRRHTMQKSTRNSSTSFATSCIRQIEKLPQKRNLLRMNLATLGVTGTCCVVSVLIDRSMDCRDSTRPMSRIHCSDQKMLNELTKITFTCFTCVDFAYSELYLRNNSFALANVSRNSM